MDALGILMWLCGSLSSIAKLFSMENSDNLLKELTLS